jgi:hypothetical protein
VSLWTDRDDPYARGEGVRVHLSTDQPAYVTVFRVDTDGQLRVLFPREPWVDARVPGSEFEVTDKRGGRSFMVDDDPGVGYLLAVASTRPFDYGDITRGDYWDYRAIGGGRVQEDPYVFLSDLARRVAPDGAYGYDIIPYYVERRYGYPRFVCYDCHAYASYSEWDPYQTECGRFRVVIYDDPRYYAYRSGRGRNVVVERPLGAGPRYVFRDADPRAGYVTHLPRPPGREGYRDRRDGERSSLDVGGRGSIPAPGPAVPARRPVQALPPTAHGERPAIDEEPRVRRRQAPAPRSTGEPELRRRKP